MFNAEEILNFDNWGAFATAIFYKQYLTPESAFKVFMAGPKAKSIDHGIKGAAQEKVNEIYGLRKAGFRWKEINEMVGMKSACSYYGHRKEMLV